jgi:replicative DNA helicase Mcm
MDKNEEQPGTGKTEDWSRLLKSKYKKEMGEISREYPHKRSLKIDYRDIERFGKVGIALAD